jgi:hypothetical protein
MNDFLLGYLYAGTKKRAEQFSRSNKKIQVSRVTI